MGPLLVGITEKPDFKLQNVYKSDVVYMIIVAFGTPLRLNRLSRQISTNDRIGSNTAEVSPTFQCFKRRIIIMCDLGASLKSSPENLQKVTSHYESPSNKYTELDPPVRVSNFLMSRWERSPELELSSLATKRGQPLCSSLRSSTEARHNRFAPRTCTQKEQQQPNTHLFPKLSRKGASPQATQSCTG